MTAGTRESLLDDLQGLSAAEVTAKAERGESNVAAAKSGRTYARVIFENTFTPVNTVLFVISGVLIALSLYGDAFMTAGLVLLNVVIGSFQEARAKRRLDQIALLVRPEAIAVRDGQEVTIKPEEIVLGDLLVVRPGDQVQVDGVVRRGEAFSVDESLLTGESDMVQKHEGDALYSGSFCTTGAGLYEAQKVGAESFANQMTQRGRSSRRGVTPLQREVSLIIVAMAILVMIVGVAVGNSFLSIYGGLPIRETARAAAVIVALIPQGLAFMVTVTYALGAVRISGLGALVQRMSAVEGLSHVDVLCFDKTGTLTTNELKLEMLEPLGAGEDRLRELLGVFTASSAVTNRTTAAVLDAIPAEPLPALAEVPFDSARKWSALAFDSGGVRGIYALGAPEVLSKYVPDRTGLDAAVGSWAERGLRVLLFAGTQNVSEVDVLASKQELPPLEALGLVVLRDELRQEAAETIDQFRDAGIRLKVLSGDNPDTVAALAQQVGIEGEGGAVSGSDLDAAAGRFDQLAESKTIFGRISPDHKEQLIEALQRPGHFVAMIGDGVNDIPALKRANVSVSVRSGSPATRGIADIILINDSFSVLPPALIEGQRIRGGMQTIIRLFLVRTLSISLLILAASLVGDEFPTTPRLAGIPALLTVGLPALVLAFYSRPAKTAQFLVPASAEFVVSATLSLAVQLFLVYHGFLVATDDLELARTAATVSAVLCGLVLIPYVRRPSQNDGLRNPDPRLALISVAMLPILACIFVIEPLRDFYEITTPSAGGFGIIALAAIGWAAVLHFLWKLRWSPQLPKSWGL